jgi:adenylate cyclase
MSAEGQPHIGARRVTATVMFNDLRGFTTLSEDLDPELVIDLLNKYLGLMSDAVLDNGGTLVAYLGDGMISVFGAPIEVADHADRCVTAAREMVGPRLAELNAWARARGLAQELRMGVGIHSGPLMSGNVGSERRLEYTVIGDTANTASRVEAMTKEHGLSLLVTQDVIDRLSGPDHAWTFVDEVAPRGRTSTVRLWTVDQAGAP